MIERFETPNSRICLQIRLATLLHSLTFFLDFLTVPMSAPQIPNLNTLRRGGLRRRGRGTALGSTRNDVARKANNDEIIRNTDNDAATSRLSAVEAGYLDDPFAKLLSGNEEVSRRLPLMNRGEGPPTTLPL